MLNQRLTPSQLKESKNSKLLLRSRTVDSVVAAEEAMAKDAEVAVDVVTETTAITEVRAVEAVAKDAEEVMEKNAEVAEIAEISVVISKEVADVVDPELKESMKTVRQLSMVLKPVDIARDTKERPVKMPTQWIALPELDAERETTEDKEVVQDGARTRRQMLLKKRKQVRTKKKGKPLARHAISVEKKKPSRLLKTKKKSDSLLMTTKPRKRTPINSQPREENTPR